MKFNISINNKNFILNKNLNIIQVCNLYNIDIPKFCYHEKLSIAGNCRMCLVEVSGVLKPVASCALPISDNMKIYTNSKLVKKAREGILEFILINHPLDCPICDQGGECDLQDQSLIFGNDIGRFYEYKRSVNDKNCGPLIKTVMTRCIHCTRCVRFIDEIAGFKYLGLIGRGNSMEVINFSNKIILSEISGNLIDLCPVGALTSKPYSFIARSWELNSINTIDLNDNMHVNIRVDVRDFKILRILPRNNRNLNENWISDITRFCFDGIQNNRLIFPYLKKEGIFAIQSWSSILHYLKNILQNKKRINFILGNFLDLETIILLKKITKKIGNYSIKINLNSNNQNFNNDFRKTYIFNIKINDLIKFKNFFLIGLNLRLENPLLNIRLKFISNKKNIKVFSIGNSFNNNYFLYNFSNNIFELIKIFEGKSVLNNIIISNNQNFFLFGESFLNLFKNNFLFLNFLNYLKNNFYYSFLNNNVLNILNNDLNLEYNINNFNDKTYNSLYIDNEIVYCLNIDGFFFNKKKNDKMFYIFQGHHLLKNINIANFNVLLPTVTFFEKSNNFLNFFGLIQKTKFILFPNKNSRTDFRILYIIFKFIKNLNINILNLTYDFFSLNFFNFSVFNKNFNFLKFKFNNLNSSSYITNIYKFNQILRSSIVLLICNKEIKKKYSNFI
jgi:NADH-quinone oxidoreductase subunit G